MADQFAVVRDDARVLVDRLECEHTPTMEFRSPSLDARQLRVTVHAVEE
jgi:hypothetical protein